MRPIFGRALFCGSIKNQFYQICHSASKYNNNEMCARHSCQQPNGTVNLLYSWWIAVTAKIRKKKWSIFAARSLCCHRYMVVMMSDIFVVGYLTFISNCRIPSPFSFKYIDWKSLFFLSNFRIIDQFYGMALCACVCVSEWVMRGAISSYSLINIKRTYLSSSSFRPNNKSD